MIYTALIKLFAIYNVFVQSSYKISWNELNVTFWTKILKEHSMLKIYCFNLFSLFLEYKLAFIMMQKHSFQAVKNIPG